MLCLSKVLPETHWIFAVTKVFYENKVARSDTRQKYSVTFRLTNFKLGKENSILCKIKLLSASNSEKIVNLEEQNYLSRKSHIIFPRGVIHNSYVLSLRARAVLVG